jgi:carbamoyltransferase
MSKIIGISALYHDSAAALVIDGDVVAAAQEERFSRVKHDASFPATAIRYCLAQARLRLADIDAVVFYENPALKRERQIDAFVRSAPHSYKAYARFARRIFVERDDIMAMLDESIAKIDPISPFRGQLVAGSHHASHAASAFYPSPFAEAAILTVDGVGEWETTSISRGAGNRIDKLKTIHFPHSLGLLYSAFTAYCGFRVNDGEYKLMGLAPYGTPRYATRIRDSLIDLKADGSFRLDLSYFDYLTSDRMFNEAFAALFDGPPRRREDPVTQRHMDVAASIQAVTEEVLLALAAEAVKAAGVRKLCLAGGVALNCVANGKILRSGLVDAIWIQPAAGDAGGALGCALKHYYDTTGAPRAATGQDAMRGARLGPAYAQELIEDELKKLGAVFEVLDEQVLIAATAQALAVGETVAWFDGRMEFGPRALGGRSILADPRRLDMQRQLNLKVKFRESFRPFAPIVLAEEAAKWFELEGESPYMLIVAPLRAEHRKPLPPEAETKTGMDKLGLDRATIPAVTHVDYSARVQTVDRERNPRLYALLRTFAQLTGTPVLVNTSFNVNDEPIVCTPADAYRCFVKTELDRLVVGRCVLERKKQPPRQIAAPQPVRAAAGAQPDDSIYTLY